MCPAGADVNTCIIVSPWLHTRPYYCCIQGDTFIYDKLSRTEYIYFQNISEFTCRMGYLCNVNYPSSRERNLLLEMWVWAFTGVYKFKAFFLLKRQNTINSTARTFYAFSTQENHTVYGIWGKLALFFIFHLNHGVGLYHYKFCWFEIKITFITLHWLL